jgi:hypothetical protein
LLPLPLFFGITSVAEVVVQLVLGLEPLHVLTVHGKVLRFTLLNKSCPIFFFQIFILTEGVPFSLQIFTSFLLLLLQV